MSCQRVLFSLSVAACGILMLGGRVWAAGDTYRDYVVEVSARADASPPAIVLSWPESGATSDTVYRRDLGTTDWGVGTNIGVATSYTDAAVSVGSAYEYRVGDSGYIYAGIEVPWAEDRGKVVLLVDADVAGALSNELVRLQGDLIGDGWTVLRHDVPRTMAITNVKALVQAAYDTDPANVKSLFVFGHVPVPYSGNINPDGHGYRAFPTDLYYAELTGTTWTDSSVNSTGFGSQSGGFPYTENWNIPGDGKFDQSRLESVPELESGRVDLYDMPIFDPLTDVDLLRRYLDKNHAFRHGRINVQRRGLVHDTWTITSTAKDGWRNFAPCFGASNVFAASWWDMETASYLWSYSCGLGDKQTDPRSNFATKQLNTVFSMRFGSWSADWNDPDNVMRCVLGSAPSALTCSWAGGPYNQYYWYYHPMALGYTAGYSARYTQGNQSSSYPTPVYGQLVGDPTLRMHPVVTPSNLTATAYSDGVALHWDETPAAVRGYAVYRAATKAGPFRRLTELLTGNDFYDRDPTAGACVYMVRAIALETSGSGSYLNPSQGIFASATGNGTLPPAPTGLSASDGTASDRVRLDWNPVAGATQGYTIWRAITNDTGLALSVGTTQDAAWDDTSAFEDVAYTYWVKARNGAGASAFSVGDSGWQGGAPAQPPAGLAASNGLETNRVRVTWSALPGQTASYEVWRSATADSASATLLAGSLAGTEYNDAPPLPGTVYYYWVRSVKSNGTSGFGVPATGHALLPAPTDLVAGNGTFADRVEVAWSAVPLASGYEVWRALDSTNFASAVTIGEAPATNAVDTTPSHLLCTYWVRATNAVSSGEFSAHADGFFGPLPPDTFWASDGSYTDRVVLAWQRTPSPTSSGFEFWRHTSTNIAEATRIGSIPLSLSQSPNETFFFTDTNVVSGVDYYYWSRGTNLAVGEFSAPDTGFAVATAPAAPPPPTGMQASDGLYTNAIKLSWTASPGATEYVVAGYIYPGQPTWYSTFATTTDTNYLYSGGAYATEMAPIRYAVQARNAGGVSLISDSDLGYPLLPAPTSVDASDGRYTDRITLDWSEVGWEDSFEVWRSSTNELGAAVPVVTSLEEIPYVDTNVTAGATWHYWVRGSVDSAQGVFSAAESGYTTVAAPPTNVAASDGTYTDRIRVTWDASSGAPSYQVWRGSSADGSLAVWLDDTTGTDHDDLAVLPGEMTWYWIRAIAGGVTSALSVADSGFAAAPPEPTGFVDAGDGTMVGAVPVVWSPVSGAGAYQVWRSSTNELVSALRQQITTMTHWNDTGVVPDSAYYYWIAATNAAGTSPFSASDRGYSPLPAPTGVTVSSDTVAGRITVGWGTVAEATAYEVWRSALDSEDDATLIASVATNRYEDDAVAALAQWYYRIKARGTLSTSLFSASAPSLPPQTPIGVAASDGAFTGMVRVAWAPVATATGYEVWRGTENNVLSAVKRTDTTATSFDDVGAPDTMLWYWVTATSAVGSSGFSLGDYGWPIWPNGTNVLPYAESFEEYPIDFSLPGGHGWYAAEPDSSVVSADPTALAAQAAYTAACGYPLAGNRTRVLKLAGDAEIALAAPTNATIWIDILTQFTFWKQADAPTVGTDFQFTLYARTNGHLVLHHRWPAQATNVWTELDRSVATGQWYRITARMDYATEDAVYGARYFQLDVDGTTVSNAAAYSTNDGTGSAGGTWFAAAWATNTLSHLGFKADGYVDDIVVSTENPHHRLAPLGTPEWWLIAHDLTNAPSVEEMRDTDHDGLAAWQEFIAGTNPTNPASVFRFSGPAPAVIGPRLPLRFDSVVGRRYRMAVSTNLPLDDWQPAPFTLFPGGSLQQPPLTATGEATTIFVEPAVPQAFYRGTVER
jgi:hypothetical protein